MAGLEISEMHAITFFILISGSSILFNHIIKLTKQSSIIPEMFKHIINKSLKYLNFFSWTMNFFGRANETVVISTDITCCVCEEVYNLEERKPLLLPCSHTFCRSCLQQLKSTNNELCPVCRASWTGQTVDSLPFIRQLADSSDKVNIKTKVRSSPNQTICAEHQSDHIAWCKICNVSCCITCLKSHHKACDWVTIEEMTDELIGNLHESVTSTRAKLIEKFTYKAIANNYLLNDIRDNIKKMHLYEEFVVTFATELSAKQEQTMNLLEKFENIPSDPSVNELATTISEILSLLDDRMTGPKIPKFVITVCDEPADDIDLVDETVREVSPVSSTVTTTSGAVRPAALDIY